MLKFIHRVGNVKWHTGLPVLFANENRDESSGVRYDLQVNPLRTPHQYHFIPLGFFSVDSVLTHTFRTPDFVYHDIQNYAVCINQHFFPNILLVRYGFPAFTPLRSSVHNCLRTPGINYKHRNSFPNSRSCVRMFVKRGAKRNSPNKRKFCQKFTNMVLVEP